MDNVTKVLLGLIAIGVWANVMAKPPVTKEVVTNDKSLIAIAATVLVIHENLEAVQADVNALESDVSSIKSDVEDIGDYGICANRRICG